MARRTGLWSVVLMIVMVAPALAHHSFAVYDHTRTLTIQGTVTKFQWTNPHGFIELDVHQNDGSVKHYSVELTSINMMQRVGWRSNMIKPGDKVQIVMAPLLSGGTFMLTYGDGVSDVPLDRLLAFHKSHGKLATVTAVPALARFGNIIFEGDRVADFAEKRMTDDAWINGGYMVMEPRVLDYLSRDEDVLEVDLLERLTSDGQLAGYKHEGFWQCMDTLRDKQGLERLWLAGSPPWKRW